MLLDAAFPPSLLPTAPRVSAKLPRHNISWSSCKQNGLIPRTCGALKVFLDLRNRVCNQTLHLELVKCAVEQPAGAGTSFNPGGQLIPTGTLSQITLHIISLLHPAESTIQLVPMHGMQSCSVEPDCEVFASVETKVHILRIRY
jgi:hypothetical protein